MVLSSDGFYVVGSASTANKGTPLAVQSVCYLAALSLTEAKPTMYLAPQSVYTTRNLTFLLISG